MNSISQSEKDSILDFISTFCGVPRCKISMKSEIVGDLHIEGDDAVELIEELSKLLNVDAIGFDFSTYFVSEGTFNPLNGLIGLIKGRDKKNKLSIEELVELLIKKRF